MPEQFLFCERAEVTYIQFVRKL